MTTRTVPRPSEKDKRYDRQLRLWGDHGQRCLESANVCLINTNATGTEILKNLVLPGIGAFTIVDSERVTPTDLGSNFFLTPSQLGAARGACALELIRELNSEVRSSFIEESVESIISTNPSFFDQFSLVIAVGVFETTLKSLDALLWEKNIPLVIARSYGFVGYVRLVTSLHEVVESHPDNYHEDLRLDCPFPALEKYLESISLLDEDAKVANIPYLAILYRCLQEWKQKYSSEMPKSYHDKKKFKELIRSSIQVSASSEEEFDNIEEAVNNVNSILVPTVIPSAVQSIMEHENSTNITVESTQFWMLVRAMKEFVACEGSSRLPVRGSIPDMTSSSEMYIKLQHLYQQQARVDMETVRNHLCQLLACLGKPTDTISEGDIKLFCRNAAFLRVVSCRSLLEEYNFPRREELAVHLGNPDGNLACYILLRAADIFYSRYKSYPGNSIEPFHSDVAEMKAIVTTLLSELEVADCVIEDGRIEEFCRYGASELHSVAAYVGGVVSQEIIKILTKQYVPLKNTYMYNAATGTSSTFQL